MSLICQPPPRRVDATSSFGSLKRTPAARRRLQADDLDSYVSWLSVVEKRMKSKGLGDLCGTNGGLGLVEACQWLSKGKALKEEYLRRERATLVTAVELCGESPDIQRIEQRSKTLLKAINVHIAKVESLCVLLSEMKQQQQQQSESCGDNEKTEEVNGGETSTCSNNNHPVINDEKLLSTVCQSGAKVGLTNEEILNLVIPEIKSAIR